MKVYTYVVVRDYGFAPNPYFGTCTLAACKPRIRRSAVVGDWVVGTGSAENNKAGVLVYAMRVDEIVTFDQYWADPRFVLKRPNLQAPGLAFRFGDNIYHTDEGGAWIQEDSHHSFTGGVLNEDNLERDTGRTDKVLLSCHFTYYGGNGPVVPAHLQDMVCPGRDHRCNFPEDLKARFIEWLESLPKGYLGEPSDLWRALL